MKLSIGAILFSICTFQVHGQLDTTDPSVQQNIIQTHNTWRRETQSTATFELTWDDDASQLAQNWADRCVWGHPTFDQTEFTTIPSGLFCGQSIAGGESWDQAMGLWYAEKDVFKFGQVNDFLSVGHYTAAVWNTTYKMGCGHALCTGGDPMGGDGQWHYYVCGYCPGGNSGGIGSIAISTPYEQGTPCSKCPDSCNEGLCTNPCLVKDFYGKDNCNQLFPDGCENLDDWHQNEVKNCQATCQCKGTLLY